MATIALDDAADEPTPTAEVEPPSTRRWRRLRSLHVAVGPVVLIAGTLISVLLGLLFAVMPDGHTDDILGFAVGLLGIVLCLQIETALRMHTRTEAEDQASKLLASVEKVPSLLKNLSEIATAASAALDPDQRPVYRKRAQETLEHTKDVLAGIARGQVEVGLADGSALRPEFAAAQRSISAASAFPGQADFWTSASGDIYLKMHKALTTRSRNRVKIARYFIVDDRQVRGNKDLEATLEDVLQRQRDAGVYVACVDAGRLPPELNRPVILIDDAFVQEEINAAGVPVGYRYSTNPADIHRVRLRMDGIAARAKTWAPVSPS